MTVTSQLPNLSNRAVLITGASSGLGAHFARVAAKAGASVALAARRKDRLQALTDEIESAGGRAAAIEMDVSSEESIMAGFDAAERALGPINSVVANAGMNLPGSALSIPLDDFRQVVDINLTGVFATAREAARRMIANGSPESGDGRIVLVGSVGSHTVMDKVIAYNVTKAAVLMMGKSLAKEWAMKGINVNVICPGWIETEINSEWLGSAAGKAMIEGFPRQRTMQPEDLEFMTMFLLSDTSAKITGGSFELDDAQPL